MIRGTRRIARDCEVRRGEGQLGVNRVVAVGFAQKLIYYKTPKGFANCSLGFSTLGIKKEKRANAESVGETAFEILANAFSVCWLC